MTKNTTSRVLIISIMYWATISFLWPQVHLSACTAFVLERDTGGVILGKNLDWDTGEGLIYVNKREISKEALMINPSVHGKPARWTSRYGSVTFISTQPIPERFFGRDLGIHGTFTV